MATFQIVMTDEHMEIVERALDLFTRVQLGQMEEVLDLFRWDGRKHKPGQEETGPVTLDDMRAADEHLNCVKELLTGFSRGASWSIGSPEVPDAARVAYDVRQVMRQKRSYAKAPEGGMTVNFDDPMRWGKLPLVEARLIEDNQWRFCVLSNGKTLVHRGWLDLSKMKDAPKVRRSWDASSRAEALRVQRAFRRLEVEDQNELCRLNWSKGRVWDFTKYPEK